MQFNQKPGIPGIPSSSDLIRSLNREVTAYVNSASAQRGSSRIGGQTGVKNSVTAGSNVQTMLVQNPSAQTGPTKSAPATGITTRIAPVITVATQRTGQSMAEPELPEGAQADSATEVISGNSEKPAQHWANQLRLSPAEARRGIILMEVLGEPLSKKRRIGRWR